MVSCVGLGRNLHDQALCEQEQERSQSSHHASAPGDSSPAASGGDAQQSSARWASLPGEPAAAGHSEEPHNEQEADQARLRRRTDGEIEVRLPKISQDILPGCVKCCSCSFWVLQGCYRLLSTSCPVPIWQTLVSRGGHAQSLVPTLHSVRPQEVQLYEWHRRGKGCMQMGSSGRGRLDNGTHELRAHSLRLSPDRQSEPGVHENSSSSLTHMVMPSRPLSLPYFMPGLHLHTPWSSKGAPMAAQCPHDWRGLKGLRLAHSHAVQHWYAAYG